MRLKKIKIIDLLKSPNTFTVFALLLIFLIAKPLYKNFSMQLEVGREIDTLENEIKNLESKNTDLKNLISYLNSDDFTEEQARLNLNYKKEGEEVLIIKNQQESPQTENEILSSKYNIKGLKEKTQEPKKDNNYKKWLEYFFD